MTSTASKKIRKLLECPLCNEQFKVPKTLPCLHSFCADCLNKHIVKIRPDFYCPSCSAGPNKLFIAGCHTAENLSTNTGIEQFFDICDLVEKLEEELTKKSKEFEEELAKSRKLAKESEVELQQTRQSVNERDDQLAKTRQSLTERENELTQSHKKIKELEDKLSTKGNLVQELEGNLTKARKSLEKQDDIVARLCEFIHELDEEASVKQTWHPNMTFPPRRSILKSTRNTGVKRVTFRLTPSIKLISPNRKTDYSSINDGNDIKMVSFKDSPSIGSKNTLSLNQTWKLQDNTGVYKCQEGCTCIGCALNHRV